VASNLGNNEELGKKITDKLNFSFKRVRDAFSTMDIGKHGNISMEDLKIYFGSWGLTPDQFDWLLRKFDKDQDGKISYVDFM